MEQNKKNEKIYYFFFLVLVYVCTYNIHPCVRTSSQFLVDDASLLYFLCSLFVCCYCLLFISCCLLLNAAAAGLVDILSFVSVGHEVEKARSVDVDGATGVCE